MKTRIQIILTYINTGSTAATAILETQFQLSAQLGSRSFVNRRSMCMPEWMKVYIEAQIIIYPTIYPRECVQMIADNFNLQPGDLPSISAVRGLLKELNIT